MERQREREKENCFKSRPWIPCAHNPSISLSHINVFLNKNTTELMSAPISSRPNTQI